MKKRIKLILIIIVIICVIGVSMFLFLRKNDNASLTKTTTQILEIDYGKGKEIKLTSLKKGKVYDNTIVITNNSDDTIYYLVKWINVSNNYVYQNKLLYEIDTEDNDAAYIGKSQLPIADSPLFDKVKLEKGKSHKYFVSIEYNGNINKEKNRSFTGILKIDQVK